MSGRAIAMGLVMCYGLMAWFSLSQRAQFSPLTLGWVDIKRHKPNNINNEDNYAIQL